MSAISHFNCFCLRLSIIKIFTSQHAEQGLAPSAPNRTKYVMHTATSQDRLILPVTSLMAVYIAAQLPAAYQCFIRSAGSAGQHVFEELVSQNGLALFVKLGPCENAEAECDVEWGEPDQTPAFSAQPITFQNSAYDGTNHVPISKAVLRPDLGREDRVVVNVNTVPPYRSLSLNAVKDICRRLLHPKHLVVQNANGLEVIGNNFMENCSSLVTLSLLGVEDVLQVGYSFLFGCTHLQALTVDSGMPHLKVIGGSFLRSC